MALYGRDFVVYLTPEGRSRLSDRLALVDADSLEALDPEEAEHFARFFRPVADVRIRPGLL